MRGFDFDYIGLLWLNDLIWRNGPYGRTLLAKVRQSYRILLTRAIHELYVWIPDEETRQHVSVSPS